MTNKEKEQLKKDALEKEPVAPEETVGQDPEVAPEPADTAVAPVTPAEKVYKFKSENKFLSCTGLGVQFIDGEASTTSVEVARALVNIEGVTRVEED